LVGSGDTSQGRHDDRFERPGAPPCPRCPDGGIVVRAGDLRIACLRPESWTCRACRFQILLADLAEQRRRLHAEVDRILREASA
jgi:hypothetical protein